MNKNTLLSTLIALSMIFFGYSCKTEDPIISIVDSEMNDANWIKLILTGKTRGVSAIYGNYEDTLIVAVLGQIHMTTDKGVSWKEVYDRGSVGIAGISEYNGELVAFNSFGEKARNPFLFSQDNGETWSLKGKMNIWEYDSLEAPRSEVKITENLRYFVEYRDDVVNGPKYDPVTKLPLPDQIFKVQEEEITPFDLPSKRRINCIVLDKKGRLNVGAEGTRFEYNIKGNTKTYPTQTDTAIVYISRKPVTL